MPELCDASVLHAVTDALHRAFPNAPIHIVPTEQGVHAGDFHVIPVSTGARQGMHLHALGPRWIQLDVCYYGAEGGWPTPDRKAGGGRQEISGTCLEVAEGLAQALDCVITPEGQALKCREVVCTMEDSVLHALVTYPYLARVPEPAVEPMKCLSLQG